MSFFLFYLIVLYYYKIHIIGIDWFTVFYYIKYNLAILTGVPRISFDMWMNFYIQLVKCDDHCKDLHLWCTYF